MEDTKQDGKMCFDGSHVTFEEGTLASLGLDPDKASKLDSNYKDYAKETEQPHHG